MVVRLAGIAGIDRMMVMHLFCMHHVLMMFFRCDRMLVRMLVPLGVMLIDPVGMMLGPPAAVMPFVMLVVVAGAYASYACGRAAPAGMSRGPLGMVLIYPVGIVLMPPVGIVPMFIGTVGAVAGAVGDLAPDLRIILHELLQSRMLVPPFSVVKQA